MMRCTTRWAQRKQLPKLFKCGQPFKTTSAKKFIKSVLVQNLDPQGGLSAEQETRLLKVQELYDKEPASPPQEQTEFCRHLLKYTIGQSFVEVSALEEINQVLRQIGHKLDIKDRLQMEQLMKDIGFLKENDNPFRMCHTDIELPAAAHGEVEKHINVRCPYDRFRVKIDHNVYAIDSASTSEVDDAIGIHVDENGVEWLTVYVSDATVHCPFGSDLQDLTGKQLATTTYLPEGVWFMLPHKIVEEATLRGDRPCRTFQLKFRIDPATAEVHDYSVEVGWVSKLRRITYDAVQELYDKGPNWSKPLSTTPDWATEQDIKNIQRIHHYAKLRLDNRLKKPNGFQTSLPEPLIEVKDRKVVSLKDQILNTKDARIAVAELMIAANEVCAKIADSIKQPITFRGSRPFNTNNEASQELVDPYGVSQAEDRTDSVSGAFAATIFDNLDSLKNVTRAFYFQEPLHHNGLIMDYYCHSTSPLRRYADMLVHHQLKVHIARQNNEYLEDFIDLEEMTTLCSNISNLTNSNRIMQKSATRFWVLSHIRDLFQDQRRDSKEMRIDCLVGRAKSMKHSLEHRRDASPTMIVQVYIPQFQITHVVSLNEEMQLGTGDTLTCVVKCVEPSLNVLDLRVVNVRTADSASAELLEQAMVPFGDR